MLWFASCCARHERAEKVDKWMKYSSSIVVSFSLPGSVLLRHPAPGARQRSPSSHSFSLPGSAHTRRA